MIRISPSYAFSPSTLASTPVQGINNNSYLSFMSKYYGLVGMEKTELHPLITDLRGELNRDEHDLAPKIRRAVQHRLMVLEAFVQKGDNSINPTIIILDSISHNISQINPRTLVSILNDMKQSVYASFRMKGNNMSAIGVLERLMELKLYDAGTGKGSKHISEILEVIQLQHTLSPRLDLNNIQTDRSSFLIPIMNGKEAVAQLQITISVPPCAEFSIVGKKRRYRTLKIQDLSGYGTEPIVVRENTPRLTVFLGNQVFLYLPNLRFLIAKIPNAQPMTLLRQAA